MSKIPISEHSPTDSSGLIRVAKLEDLKAAGMLVVRGARTPLLVVYHQGQVFALDNRCPHLGFPLHRGSVEDGILTCHWHHARFDLASGCTFDLWVDDVPTAAVEIRDGVVWVDPRTRYTDERHLPNCPLLWPMGERCVVTGSPTRFWRELLSCTASWSRKSDGSDLLGM